uniref:Putative secreted protein n=1 Tax=Anopheles triannulatus TaxID=58253 RepID=A0A2M4B3R0_9DIPT
MAFGTFSSSSRPIQLVCCLPISSSATNARRVDRRSSIGHGMTSNWAYRTFRSTMARSVMMKSKTPSPNNSLPHGQVLMSGGNAVTTIFSRFQKRTFPPMSLYQSLKLCRNCCLSLKVVK